MKTRRLLTAAAALIGLTTGCTPQEFAVWEQWLQIDPPAATEFADDYIASAGTSAVRENPEGSASVVEEDGPPGFSSNYSNGRCVGAEPLLAYYSPGWNVSTMSAIMYRESRCNPSAYNRSGASGLLQVMKSHCGWLSGRVGPCDLFDAHYNIRAGAAVWEEQGYQAWSTY